MVTIKALELIWTPNKQHLQNVAKFLPCAAFWRKGQKSASARLLCTSSVPNKVNSKHLSYSFYRNLPEGGTIFTLTLRPMCIYVEPAVAETVQQLIV